MGDHPVLAHKPAQERLRLANLGMKDKDSIPGAKGPFLAVPPDGPELEKIFADSEFHKGVWYHALKQAPAHIVLRDKGNAQKVKINGFTKHCLLVDLAAFEAFTAKED